MNTKKLSSRLHTIIKSAFVAALLPVLFVYVIVAKPDYKLMNGLAHVVLPVAHGIGDAITWPFRAGADVIKYFHNISNLESENEELKIRLAQALAQKNECDVVMLENQRLAHELDVTKNTNFETVVADVIYNNSAIHHRTFVINRGKNDGIDKGMVVVSFDNTLVGVVIDSGVDYSRVRSLTDSGTNIAVRIAGSDVFGFLHGNGSNTPNIGFFSDSKFQGSKGVKLITSGISGILPPDIYVGKLKNDTDVDVLLPGEFSRVMILKFNTQGKYK
ncbi:MAG: rod shape-determining protein MreC [Alphaproteobacteria bacterium]|nr:rod shape-determining protein MreC [Alphaproteobacteria bacterium]